MLKQILSKRTLLIFGSLFVLFVSVFSFKVEAKDYYVSSLKAEASDSGTGIDPSKPWKTINKMITEWGKSILPGDTVHLERGSAFEVSSEWYMEFGGTSSGQMTIRGDDYGDQSKPKPIIKRIINTQGAFVVIQASYVTLSDLILDGNNQDVSGISVGFTEFSKKGAREISNVNILNMVIKNLGGKGKYISGIWLSNKEKISNVLIEGNEVSDYSAHGLNHYSPGPLENITWRGNRVINNYPDRFEAACALQIQAGSSGSVFEDNYLEDKTLKSDGAICIFNKHGNNDSGTNVIRNNEIINSGTAGISFQMDSGGDTNGKPSRLLYDVYENDISNSKEAGLIISPYKSNIDYYKDSRINIHDNLFSNNLITPKLGKADVEISLKGDNNNYVIFNNNVINHTASDKKALLISDIKGVSEHKNNQYLSSVGGDLIKVGSTSYSLSSIKSFESTAQDSEPILKEAQKILPPVAFFKILAIVTQV